MNTNNLHKNMTRFKTKNLSEQQSIDSPSNQLRASVMLFHDELKKLESYGYKPKVSFISNDAANTQYGPDADKYLQKNAYIKPVKSASTKFPYSVTLSPSNIPNAPSVSQLAKLIDSAIKKNKGIRIGQLGLGAQHDSKYTQKLANMWRKLLGLEQIWANVPDDRILKLLKNIRFSNEGSIASEMRRMVQSNNPDIMGLVNIHRSMTKANKS